MDIAWYLVLVGVHLLHRRRPACSRAATRWSILLCLELMLNAGNLALIAFSRMCGNARRPDLRAHRDGRRRLRGRRRPRR